MQIFFILCLNEILRLIFSLKTDIKFTLNVPSLFRCKRNGPVFYFENFPSDELFNRTITNKTKECDLTLISNKKRVILTIYKHVLQCQLFARDLENRIGEILFFKSNCAMNGRDDFCLTSIPTIATITSDESIAMSQPAPINFPVHGIGTDEIQIGDQGQYPYSWKKDGYTQNGVRRFQITFNTRYEGYLNMVCQYTYVMNDKDEQAVCRIRYFVVKNDYQVRTGTATSTGKGWSWLCYYYPSGAEQAFDYDMINKARLDWENGKGLKSPVPTSFSLPNITESLENSSVTSSTPTQSSSGAIVGLLVILIIAGGMWCICKKKCQVKTKESDVTRNSTSSIESFDSDQD